MASLSDQETEIKIRVRSAAMARRRILALGYVVSVPRTFEANTVLDDETASLRSSQRLLRVRTAGRVHTVTYKGPSTAGRHRTRLELESVIADAAMMARILGGLGFTPKLHYEKYRTEFTKPRQRGIIMLDELPYGIFLELEGESGWIDRTARALGYTDADYITTSYVGLSPAPGDIRFAPKNTRLRSWGPGLE